MASLIFYLKSTYPVDSVEVVKIVFCVSLALILKLLNQHIFMLEAFYINFFLAVELSRDASWCEDIRSKGPGEKPARS